MTPWQSLLSFHTFIKVANVFYILIGLQVCVHLIVAKPKT